MFRRWFRYARRLVWTGFALVGMYHAASFYVLPWAMYGRAQNRSHTYRPVSHPVYVMDPSSIHVRYRVYLMGDLQPFALAGVFNRFEMPFGSRLDFMGWDLNSNQDLCLYVWVKGQPGPHQFIFPDLPRVRARRPDIGPLAQRDLFPHQF